MEIIYSCFLYLIKCVINNKNVADNLKENKEMLDNFNNISWVELAKISLYTKTFSFIYSAVLQCSEVIRIDSAILAKWKNDSFILMLRELGKQNHIKKLLEEAYKNNIPAVVFKGPVLSELYPQSTQRFNGDLDIWISEEYESTMMKLIENQGYTKNEDSSKQYVQVYSIQNPHYVIELHTKLWEDYEGVQIDIIKSFDLTADVSIIRKNVNGIEMLTLGNQEHLIYQVFHIVKHFMLEYISLRYLVDLSYYLTAYKNDIDIDDFWDKMEAMGYEVFCKTIFSICVIYFGLNENVLGEKMKIQPRSSVDFLLQDILNRENVSDNDAKWQFLGTMTPYFIGKKNVGNTTMKRKLEVIFLRPQDLTEEYSYAQKTPLLLPIAWIHRTASYLTRWFKDRNNTYGVEKKLEITDNRLNLIKKMGLAKSKGNEKE